MGVCTPVALFFNKSASFASMKLYVIAGEPSGDLHGSNLLKALFEMHPDLQCRVWGGDKMQAAGGNLSASATASTTASLASTASTS